MCHLGLHSCLVCEDGICGFPYIWFLCGLVPSGSSHGSSGLLRCNDHQTIPELRRSMNMIKLRQLFSIIQKYHICTCLLQAMHLSPSPPFSRYLNVIIIMSPVIMSCVYVTQVFFFLVFLIPRKTTQLQHNESTEHAVLFDNLRV